MLSLTALFLRWCSQVRDFGLQHLCSMRNLQILSLAGNKHIHHIHLQHKCHCYCELYKEILFCLLFRYNCNTLFSHALSYTYFFRSLSLFKSGCPLLTSSGLSSIIQLRHLQELELTNCPGASQELFEYLREHLPRCLIIE